MNDFKTVLKMIVSFLVLIAALSGCAGSNGPNAGISLPFDSRLLGDWQRPTEKLSVSVDGNAVLQQTYSNCTVSIKYAVKTYNGILEYKVIAYNAVGSSCSAFPATIGAVSYYTYTVSGNSLTLVLSGYSTVYSR